MAKAKKKDEHLTESVEMYLKTIFLIIEEKKVARSRDIAKAMGVSSSSVTGALRHLAASNLINYVPYDVITLTDEGEAIAVEILGRFRSLQKFFVDILALDHQEADECACRIEHVISSPVLNRIASFVEFLQQCPHSGQQILKSFNQHLTCEGPEKCWEECGETPKCAGDEKK